MIGAVCLSATITGSVWPMPKWHCAHNHSRLSQDKSCAGCLIWGVYPMGRTTRFGVSPGGSITLLGKRLLCAAFDYPGRYGIPG